MPLRGVDVNNFIHATVIASRRSTGIKPGAQRLGTERHRRKSLLVAIVPLLMALVVAFVIVAATVTVATPAREKASAEAARERERDQYP